MLEGNYTTSLIVLECLKVQSWDLINPVFNLTEQPLACYSVSVWPASEHYSCEDKMGNRGATYMDGTEEKQEMNVRNKI